METVEGYRMIKYGDLFMWDYASLYTGFFPFLFFFYGTKKKI